MPTSKAGGGFVRRDHELLRDASPMPKPVMELQHRRPKARACRIRSHVESFHLRATLRDGNESTIYYSA
jgi:hypothetical protein